MPSRISSILLSEKYLDEDHVSAWSHMAAPTTLSRFLGREHLRHTRAAPYLPVGPLLDVVGAQTLQVRGREVEVHERTGFASSSTLAAAGQHLPSISQTTLYMATAAASKLAAMAFATVLARRFCSNWMPIVLLLVFDIAVASGMLSAYNSEAAPFPGPVFVTISYFKTDAVSFSAVSHWCTYLSIFDAIQVSAISDIMISRLPVDKEFSECKLESPLFQIYV